MKIWMIFDPRRALIGLFAFLLVLALLIHFILLGTKQYNWLQGSSAEVVAVVPVVPTAGMAPGMYGTPPAQQPMTAAPGAAMPNSAAAAPTATTAPAQ